jgi:translation initiation factor 5A
MKGSDTHGPVTPIRVGEVKKGMFLVMQKRPCKVLEMTVHKTGKHGHAKASFLGQDVFTGAKYQASESTSTTVAQPVLTRKEYELLDISDDDYLCLLDVDNTTREDLKLPEGELGERIQGAYDTETEGIKVLVLEWGDYEQGVIEMK